jgi:CheY-like chemotaxis protein
MNLEKKQNILIVEDDENSYLYLLFALEERNYNISRASNGLEAINIFRDTKGDFAFILMDLKLPIIDGYQSAEAIRKIDPNIPIIAQTASYIPMIDQKLKDYKFDAVIIKPYTVDQLINAIQSVKIKNNLTNKTSQISFFQNK